MTVNSFSFRKFSSCDNNLSNPTTLEFSVSDFPLAAFH